MNSYDAVVVGGGVIGVCTAYYFVKEGLRVALLEKGDIASGTSSSCDGNILIHDKQPGFDTHLAYSSQQLFKQLINEISEDVEYRQKGSVLLIENEEEMKVAQSFARQQIEDGYPFRIIDQKEIGKQEPYLAEDIIGALEIDCDASINPMAFAFGLLERAKTMGAEIFPYTPVTGIETGNNGEVTAVISNNDTFRTKSVINCAGVWAPVIGKMVDIDIPIIPRQGQILISERTFPVGSRKIVEFGYMMAKFGKDTYKRDVDPNLDKLGIAFVFEPTASNNFLIGSSRAFMGFNTDVTIDVLKGLAKRALRFFPIMKNINVIRSYAGLRPYTSDHFPIISEVESVPGFYIAAGHEGDGIGLAPITGKLMSQLVTNKKTDIETKKLSYSRFFV